MGRSQCVLPSCSCSSCRLLAAASYVIRALNPGVQDLTEASTAKLQVALILFLWRLFDMVVILQVP